MTTKENYPVIYEISEIPFHLIRDDEEDYEADEEESEEEDLEDSDEDEESSSDDEQQEDDDSESDDEDEVVPAKIYKGLQRTVSKKDKEIQQLEKEIEEAKKEKEEAEAMLDKGDKVRLDLQKTITDQGERLSALEKENKQSKAQAMQSRVIAEEFPGLANLTNFIPSAETEDEYRENCKSLQEALGDNVTQRLEKELKSSTVPADEDEGKKPASQSEIDKKYNKAMSLAGVPGKQEEYDKAFNEYLEAVNSRQ